MNTQYTNKSAVTKETWSADRIKELTMSKIHSTAVTASTYVPRRPTRRFAVVAIAAILALSLATTALAVSGVIDFGRFYNSIFSNPKASPYVSTEDMISIIGSSDDLSIEPIAGFVGGEWNLYIQLKLTALSDTPIPEKLYILDGDFPINLGDTTISKVDGRTAIVSFRTHSGRRDSQSETISVKFNAISSTPYRIDNTGNPDNALVVGIPDSSEDALTYYGDWEVLLSANNTIETRFVKGSFDGRDATVRVEPTVIEIQVFGNEDAPYLVDSSGSINYRFDPEGTIKITLADGRVIEESRVEVDVGAGSNNDAVDEHGNKVYGMASYWCSIEFVNPAYVVSVELFGESVVRPTGR
jgi:hypothetical protein